MGQGRSEGHATADRFVYLGCLWYPAFPLHAPLRLCLQPDLEVTTQRWIKATFHHRVNTTHPTHHSGQLKTHGASVGLLPFSDKNNNWLICTCIVEPSLDTVGGISTKNKHGWHQQQIYMLDKSDGSWFKNVLKCYNVSITCIYVIRVVFDYCRIRSLLQGIQH